MSLNTFSEMAEDAALNLYLEHYGVKGQKKGSNRWWTPDKKLTPEGREHYGYGDGRKGSNKGGNDIRSQINDLENTVLVKNSDVKKLVKATKKFADSSVPGHGGVLVDRQAYWEHKINKSPIMKEIKSEMSDDVKNLKQIANKRDKMIEKFYKDEKLFNEYLNDAIEDVRKEREASNEEFTQKDRHRAEIYYKNDGRYELYRNFLISKDKRAKKHREIDHQYDASRDALQANVKKFVNEWVGELGNERVPNEWYWSNKKLTVNDFLAMRLFYSNAS